MLFKSHWMGKIAMIALLALSISACKLLAPKPGPTPTLSPSATPTTPAPPPEPTFTVSPTTEPSSPAVDLSLVHGMIRLAMIDASNGWALTDLGLLRTTDGGTHWSLVNPPGFDPSANPVGSFFQDASSAYLLTPDQNFSSGFLYHTADAGQTWTSTQVPFAMGAIQVFADQTGFAMASLGFGAGNNPVTFFSTGDGGLTWQELYSTLNQDTSLSDSLGNGGIKSGVVFLDAQHGFVTGSVPMENFAYLYATADGGLTWQHRDLPFPSGGVTSFYTLDEPVFFDGSQGLISAQQSPSDSSPVKRAFFTTRDGGVTWQSVPSIDGSGPISAPNPNDWFFWNQGKLLVTHNAGQDWQEVVTNLPLTESPASLLFIDPATGWEIHFTSDAKIHFYATTNGGQTWNPIIP